jgi:hypothetical protein
VDRLPTADYELRIVYADQLLTYEVYRDLRYALQRGKDLKRRMAAVPAAREASRGAT